MLTIRLTNRSIFAPAECAVPMCLSFRYSFIGHQILIIFMFGQNVFAYEFSLKSDNSFLVRLSLSLFFVVVVVVVVVIECNAVFCATYFKLLSVEIFIQILESYIYLFWNIFC